MMMMNDDLIPTTGSNVWERAGVWFGFSTESSEITREEDRSVFSLGPLESSRNSILNIFYLIFVLIFICGSEGSIPGNVLYD